MSCDNSFPMLFVENFIFLGGGGGGRVTKYKTKMRLALDFQKMVIKFSTYTI